MIRLKALDDLAHRLSELLPPGLEDARVDLEKNFRAALHSGFGKLDLVTREEFDVQRAVLLRTREKLALLERMLGDMEARLDAQQSPQTRN
ncbi:MAG: accessory factor UbiK family protein [Aquimonas sp.]|nr:accessory factor UbiK family protein [Aquimonas sp.]